MIIAVGMAVAIALWFLVAKTRAGMLVRAGASNRTMAGALGINIKLLFTLVFGVGAVLAGLAGMLVTPILGANSGMGEHDHYPGLRGDRDRRHRIDPRCIRGGDP